MLAFIGQAFSDYKATGAVAPSGPVLARSMTEAIRMHDGPRRVLEVGPGTGAFTKHIIEALGGGDTFHAVEVNPAFCRRIDETYLAPFRNEHPGADVKLFEALVQEAPLEGHYDFVVCGLPFNNFPLPVVRGIFRRMFDHLGNGGELTYFEYVGMRAMKVPFVGRDGRKMLRRRGAIGEGLLRRYHGRRDLVLANIPPAYSVHLRAVPEPGMNGTRSS
jgi:phosphatidylethanolamine/phosphatidyl-N-methylethanolamine N-methyltransferase